MEVIMLTSRRVSFLLAVFLLPVHSAVAAPLGRSFTYQGQLSQSGTPVDGTVHLRFSLWDAAGTGDPPTAARRSDPARSSGTF
jgi:hypothetical protein